MSFVFLQISSCTAIYLPFHKQEEQDLNTDKASTNLEATHSLKLDKPVLCKHWMPHRGQQRPMAKWDG